MRYVRASADALPFADASLDGVVSTMALMDIPDHAGVVREAPRVLRPGGMFQFSILHPCFHTRRWAWAQAAQDARTGVVCGEFLEPPNGELDEFAFRTAPPEAFAGTSPFRVPRYGDRIFSSPATEPQGATSRALRARRELRVPSIYPWT